MFFTKITKCFYVDTGKCGICRCFKKQEPDCRIIAQMGFNKLKIIEVHENRIYVES